MPGNAVIMETIKAVVYGPHDQIMMMRMVMVVWYQELKPGALNH